MPRGAKSRMRRTETPKPIRIKFCMVVDITDVVTYTNFGDHRLRGFCVAGGQISPSPIDFHRRPCNSLALPCECVILHLSCVSVCVHVSLRDRLSVCLSVCVSACACCGLQRLTGVSGDSAAQMPYRLSRRGAQQVLSPSGRPGRTLLLQEGR